MAHSIVDNVRAQRERIWTTEPKEVLPSMTQNRGTHNSLFFSALYASEDTRNLNHFFYTLRETIRKGDVDLPTVKAIVRGLLDYFIPWMSWLKLHESEELLKKVQAEMMNIETLEIYLELIEELTLYFAQLNSWVDSKMPWPQLVQAYEKHLPR